MTRTREQRMAEVRARLAKATPGLLERVYLITMSAVRRNGEPPYGWVIQMPRDDGDFLLYHAEGFFKLAQDAEFLLSEVERLEAQENSLKFILTRLMQAVESHVYCREIYPLVTWDRAKHALAGTRPQYDNPEDPPPPRAPGQGREWGMSYETSVANAEAYASHYVDVRDYPSPEAEKAVWAGVRSGFLEGERHALADPSALDELVKALRESTEQMERMYDAGYRDDVTRSMIERNRQALARFKAERGTS